MKPAPQPLKYSRWKSPWEERNGARGRTFTVTKSFEDLDGHLHAVGETWTLVGDGFNKFDDEMWFGLRTDDGAEWLMPLSWRDKPQADVIENWESYVRQT